MNALSETDGVGYAPGSDLQQPTLQEHSLTALECTPGTPHPFAQHVQTQIALAR